VKIAVVRCNENLITSAGREGTIMHISIMLHQFVVGGYSVIVQTDTRMYRTIKRCCFDFLTGV